ncbi:MAG: phosphopantothenate/pantothenate synthetase [Candidatus Thermoplasmatota archaeon]|nr:phosphopantothenate/pantothenate synthetase [Candidatus Thermoplasmatota archaeon]
MGEVPPTHPRYASLMARKRLTEAASAGMLAESALIAHGRGEAFDYLLGERTCDAARNSIREIAGRLQEADWPIISVNGNAVALAADNLIRCAAAVPCDIEVNIYYRTPERMEALISKLNERKEVLMHEPNPEGWWPDWEQMSGEWQENIRDVQILGANPDGRIPGLEGPRAECCTEGILRSDVILVPLEDGDRCEALTAMGKTVCAIDLNPLSRTAKKATITIVDELTRCLPLLLEDLVDGSMEPNEDWDNEQNLREVVSEMLRILDDAP